MRKLRLLLAVLLCLLAIAVLSCGFNHKKLQSITISPATATSRAQFVATGHYSDGSTVSPLPAQWFTIMPWYNELNEIQFFNLDETGKASCNENTGTFTVVAIAPVDPRSPPVADDADYPASHRQRPPDLPLSSHTSLNMWGGSRRGLSGGGKLRSEARHPSL